MQFLKIFVTDFSGAMQARKVNIPINMDNDWVYRIYTNRKQGFVTELCPLVGKFSKKNAFCSITFMFVVLLR